MYMRGQDNDLRMPLWRGTRQEAKICLQLQELVIRMIDAPNRDLGTAAL
jgi:hypothetical protein